MPNRNETTRDSADALEGRPAREMKVKLPVSFHVRLHSMKILTGKPISDVVTEALDAYFRDNAATTSDSLASAAGFDPSLGIASPRRAPADAKRRPDTDE